MLSLANVVMRLGFSALFRQITRNVPGVFDTGSIDGAGAPICGVSVLVARARLGVGDCESLRVIFKVCPTFRPIMSFFDSHAIHRNSLQDIAMVLRWQPRARNASPCEPRRAEDEAR